MTSGENVRKDEERRILQFVRLSLLPSQCSTAQLYNYNQLQHPKHGIEHCFSGLIYSLMLYTKYLKDYLNSFNGKIEYKTAKSRNQQNYPSYPQ